MLRSSIVSVLLLLVGCRSTHEQLAADTHRETLVVGMEMAEDALKLTNTAYTVQMKLHAGTTHRGGDRWGIIMHGKEYGGWIEMRARGVYRVNIVCDPKTMKPLLNRVAHECGRSLLHGIGIDSESEQDKRLKEAGL